MKIVFSETAIQTLRSLAQFVESKNTKGSGKRYVTKFLSYIQDTLNSFSKHAVCKHAQFAINSWRCFLYKDFVIVYSVVDDTIFINIIIHGSLIA
jgi:hypothetical protein